MTYDTNEDDSILGLSILIDATDPLATRQNSITSNSEDQSRSSSNSKRSVLRYQEKVSPDEGSEKKRIGDAR